MSDTVVHTTYPEQAAQLLARIDQDPWGSVRPSLYETARVISAAPWLPGEPQRIAYLLNEQAPDGSWGEGPERYRLLPTLSAVEAALAVLRRGNTSAGTTRRLTASVDRGLAALRALPPAGPWPDTAAAEILVPSLVARIHEQIALLADDRTDHGTAATGGWLPGPGPALPRGYDQGAPAYVAKRYAAAGGLPVKLHHTFEGIARYIPEALVPDGPDLLGSSPAATAARAAALSREPAPETVTALAAVSRRYAGSFPEAAPIVVFERLWVAAALAGAQLPAAGLPTVRQWATDLYDPRGVRGAPGLMTDADDTAMAVLVSSLVGLEHSPDPLDLFHNGTHYDCYVGEDTGSVTANAHALQALGGYQRRHPGTRHLHGPRTAGVRDWLVGRQLPEGPWPDKWHASPYYATTRCVSALTRYGADHASGAVEAAVAWTVDTQRDDGSWGVWGGTAEETAYAAQILLAAAGPRPERERALRRAETYLNDGAGDGHHPALWHDKTLYAPGAMIEAEILAVRERLRTRHDANGRQTTPTDAEK
ncbi:prenyltransferase [Streptomyces sp. NBC_01498]|uniref:prenyltransferase/squalene oxidase repeat-containing protein n=1 Tax=Streptomyces sp. NBC_01498 TaxID=2975870 RepID=UPI002E7AC6AC|nr:prenyltransferase/squalene oxidase repeat-containing protein [Streptomyces sp. NBC_01498]WTL28390.1 prenyltransferase [Streptomyces sp. NBC_01498]